MSTTSSFMDYSRFRARIWEFRGGRPSSIYVRCTPVINGRVEFDDSDICLEFERVAEILFDMPPYGIYVGNLDPTSIIASDQELSYLKSINLQPSRGSTMFALRGEADHTWFIGAGSVRVGGLSLIKNGYDQWRVSSSGGDQNKYFMYHIEASGVLPVRQRLESEGYTFLEIDTSDVSDWPSLGKAMVANMPTEAGAGRHGFMSVNALRCALFEYFLWEAAPTAIFWQGREALVAKGLTSLENLPETVLRESAEWSSSYRINPLSIYIVTK